MGSNFLFNKIKPTGFELNAIALHRGREIIPKKIQDKENNLRTISLFGAVSIPLL